MSAFVRPKSIAKCSLPAVALVAALVLVPSMPAMATDTTETTDTSNTSTQEVTSQETSDATEETKPADTVEQAPVESTQQETTEELNTNDAPAAKTATVEEDSTPEALTLTAPVLDTTKPIASILSGPAGSFNSAGATLVIGASDETGLVKIVANIYSGTTLIDPNQVAVSGTSGSLTVDLSGLTNGTYTVKYNALDTSGNVASTGQLTLVVDNTNPTITLKAGSTFVNGWTKIASFKLFDAGKIAYVTVNGVVKDLTDSVYSDLNSVKPGQFGAVEGANTIIAYDVAGNASEPYTLYLDTTGPTSLVKTGTSTTDGTKGSEGVYQFVSLKLYDQANVAKLWVNGVEKPVTDNVWSDLNGLKPGMLGAVEGENTLVFEDGLGNQSTVIIELDTTKPVLSLPSGEVISGQHTFTISQVEENPDRAYVEFMQLVDGKWKKLVGYEIQDTNTLDFTVDTTLYAEDGTYQIKVSTWDLAGNHTSATSAGFVIDNSGPTVTVKDDMSTTADGGFEELSVKLSDLNKVAYVTINGVVKDLTDDEWSDVNFIRPGVFGAVEGENLLIAYDTEGNATEFPFTLVVPVVEEPEEETPTEEEPTDGEDDTPTDETPSDTDDTDDTVTTSANVAGGANTGLFGNQPGQNGWPLNSTESGLLLAGGVLAAGAVMMRRRFGRA